MAVALRSDRLLIWHLCLTCSMQIGIQLPEIERVVPWPEYRTMAVAAEDLGYASIWLGDHLFYDKPDGLHGPWECWTLLAAIAEVTTRPLLGPLVSPTGFRNPGMLAKMAGTVDEISGERLILGLGSGWNQAEYEAFGLPFDKRVSRFEEAYQIIVDLIRTGTADVHGEFHTSTATLVPEARADIPIMIGSTGPRMLSIAAPTMNWWNEWWSRFNNDPVALEPFIEKVDQALLAAGRDPAEVTKSVAVLVSIEGDGRLMGADAAENPITGSIDSIGEQLSAFAPLVDHLQLVVDPITVDSIEKLAPIVQEIHKNS